MPNMCSRWMSYVTTVTARKISMILLLAHHSWGFLAAPRTGCPFSKAADPPALSMTPHRENDDRQFFLMVVDFRTSKG